MRRFVNRSMESAGPLVDELSDRPGLPSLCFRFKECTFAGFGMYTRGTRGSVHPFDCADHPFRVKGLMLSALAIMAVLKRLRVHAAIWDGL